MEFPKLPEWLLNIGMHAVSGFALGFSAAFVSAPTASLPDLKAAIYAACVIGMYGAIKEVMSYIQTITTTKSTAAGPVAVSNEAPKPLLKRML